MTAARQGMIWVAITIVFLLLCWYLKEVLLPFVASALLSYILHPAVTKLEQWRCPRGLGTLVVMLLTLTTLVGITLMLVPLVQAQVASLAEKLPSYVERLQALAMPLLKEIQHLAPKDTLMANLPELVKQQGGTAINVAKTITGALISGSVKAIGALSFLFLTPVITFYLLRDWPLMLKTVDSWFPRQHYDTIQEQLGEMDRTIAGFIRGQSLVCLTLGIFYALALSAAGLEFGFIIGILSGLLSFIPYVGSFTGGFISLGMALVQWGESHDWMRIAVIAAIYGVGQFIEGNILSPRFVGSRVNLHPVWVIFALFAGGALYGFLGVLLAVPVTAVIGVLARFAIRQYKASRLYSTIA